MRNLISGDSHLFRPRRWWSSISDRHTVLLGGLYETIQRYRMKVFSARLHFCFAAKNQNFSLVVTDEEATNLMMMMKYRAGGARIVWKEMGEIFPILFYNISIFSSDMVLLASNGFVICNLLAKSTTYILITTWRLTTHNILLLFSIYLSAWTLTQFGWAKDAE